MVAQLVDPLYTEALYIVVVLFCTRRHIRFLPSNRVGSNFDACALWLKSKVLLLFLSCLCGVTLLLLVLTGYPQT